MKTGLMFKNKHWWAQMDPAEGVWQALEDLGDDLEQRNARWRRYLSIFCNRTVPGWTPGATINAEDSAKEALAAGGEPRLAMNPSANCVHTLASRIASQKIRPRFMTSTSHPDRVSFRQQAEAMEKAVAGEWSRGQVYRKSTQVFYHGGALGLGAMKVFPDHNRKQVRFETVFPGLLAVDERSHLTSEPRTLYQVGYYPAEVLEARFGGKGRGNKKKVQAIWDAAGEIALTDAPVEPGYLDVTSLTETVEAWHLPSGPGASDGRHVISIAGLTLLDEPWTVERFPIAFFRWSTPILGWYPQGLIETTEPMQKQLVKLLGRIQDAMHLHSVPITFYEEGTVNEKYFKNSPGVMIPFAKGTQRLPVVNMPPSVSSEVFNFVDALYSRIFEETGVSMLSAASKKPAQIESGAAIRALQDNETGRHALLAQEWEALFVQLAFLTVDAARQLHKASGKKGYKSRYILDNKAGFDEIDWGEIDLDEDATEVAVMPSSMLPHTPAGRLAMVQDMLKAGLIDDAKTALDLLNMPDLEQYTSLKTAALRDIDSQIEKMLRGEPQHPEPYQDLEVAIRRVVSAIIRTRGDGGTDEQLQPLLDYLDEAQRLLAPPPEAPQGNISTEPPGPEMPEPPPPPQAPGAVLSTPEQPL